MLNDADREAIGSELVRQLIAERKKRGLSMNRLAEKAGLSQSLVSGLEKGPWNMTVNTLLRISCVLEVNAGELLAKAIKQLPRKKAVVVKPKAFKSKGADRKQRPHHQGTKY